MASAPKTTKKSPIAAPTTVTCNTWLTVDWIRATLTRWRVLSGRSAAVFALHRAHLPWQLPEQEQRAEREQGQHGDGRPAAGRGCDGERLPHLGVDEEHEGEHEQQRQRTRERAAARA